jgi:hypothetical protein
MATWSAACSLATLTRPNLALLFVLGLPLILFRQPRWIRRGLYVTVIFLLVLLPWTVRNYLVHHRLVFVTTMGGRVLWEGNNPYIAADAENRGRSANAPDLPEARLVTGMDESEADAFYFHLAVDWIRRNPGQALSLMVHKAIRLWNPAPNLPSRLQRWVASFSVICMLVLFLAGLVLGIRNRDVRLLPILCPVAAVTLTGLVYWADARIRAPAEPEIALVVATALAGPWRFAVARVGKRAAAP